MIEGERLLGRFTVAERIGAGGYGTVHRAWDERLCRWVAVKAIEGEAAGRVLREAHAAARLNHPGIVTLYELGHENGVTYLVSELVEGPDLRALATAGRVSDREVAEIGAELCAALAHAHAQGVIHRDIKPDNVLVRPRRGRGGGERAMLADFGIATISDEPPLTATGQVVGTLTYMAPEQAAGEPAAEEADVYSLALTLYELWSGRNPVARATPAATVRAIGEPVLPLEQLRPELPFALCALVDRGLAAEPTARPQLAELREGLRAAAGALHPERPVPEPEGAAAPSSGPEPLGTRPIAVLLAAGAIATLGIAVGLPGLAIVAAALFAPAALLLSRPAEWALPALAPLLGSIGLAPLFTVLAARHARPGGRLALAGLGWAWTAIAGLAVGSELGVAAGSSSGWAGSGPEALSGLLLPLLGADAFSTGLVWVGAAVLLGALVEFAGPALLAVLGLIWAAGLVAALSAIGGPAAPSLLLAPALIAAIVWLAWDRAGRPDLVAAGRAGALLEALSGDRRTIAAGTPPRPAPPLRRREAATVPLADDRVRAQRTASRHVRAALHGAGSRAGLP